MGFSVFVLFDCSGSEPDVVGVFSLLERAEAVRGNLVNVLLNDEAAFDIEEFEVDSVGSEIVTRWLFEVDGDGEIFSVESFDSSFVKPDKVHVDAVTKAAQVYVSAKSFDKAVAAARKAFKEFKAESGNSNG